jgi:hypothetical protein
MAVKSSKYAILKNRHSKCENIFSSLFVYSSLDDIERERERKFWSNNEKNPGLSLGSLCALKFSRSLWLWKPGRRNGREALAWHSEDACPGWANDLRYCCITQKRE